MWVTLINFFLYKPNEVTRSTLEKVLEEVLVTSFGEFSSQNKTFKRVKGI